MLLWVAPFVSILAGVMVVLYAGWATPSETAGVGAVLALLVIGIMYGVWRPSRLMPIITGTMRESSMLLLIIGFSLLYSYVMSYLHISQSAAVWLTSLGLSKWALLAAILLFVVVLGFFLPPVSIILMTAPIILPPIKAAGFDLIWFGVVMTIVMEMGLIHPPVGLNLFVIKNIAPDIPLAKVMWGALPFVFLMFLAIVLICIFPGHRVTAPSPHRLAQIFLNAIVRPLPKLQWMGFRARALPNWDDRRVFTWRKPLPSLAILGAPTCLPALLVGQLFSKYPL